MKCAETGEDDGGTPREKFTSLINSWITMVKNEPLAVRLSLQLNLDDAYRKLMKRKGKQYIEVYLERMRDLLVQLGSKNPDLDCYLLAFVFDGLTANYTVAPNLFPIDAIKDHFIETLLSRWEPPDEKNLKGSSPEKSIVKRRIKYGASLVLLLCGLTTAVGQTWSLHGQASGWLTSHPEDSPDSQIGLRYIPEVSVGDSVASGLNADLDLSFNGYEVGSFATNREPGYEGNAKLYRAWFRLSSDAFEIRVGLQKMNFGSATLFRPLMWFDRVDPRDPLQLTDGVYGLLARYYFLDNANVWLWGLYGNDETKGWEIVPTTKKTAEYGGRVQAPLSNGELGVTYHHREADFTNLVGVALYAYKSNVPENRFALDGKWDIGIGAWFEAALIHDQTDILGMQYQRQWTLGADYTFDIGNGLTALTEFFRSENPNDAFGPANGIGLSALSLNYPLGVVDRFSGILYRDWTNRQWYRLITWQRTYDNWIIYLLGFSNPQNIQLYRIQVQGAAGQTASNTFAGTGFQLMLVFNH